MKPRKIILERTPQLHEWLGRKLSKNAVTQRQLATLIGRTTPQVNRWLSGKEPIPAVLFLQAVSAAINEESRTAEHLLSIHQRAKLLPLEAVHILSTGGSEAALAVAKTVGQRAEESAASSEAEDTAAQYMSLSDYLGAGLHVLNMMKACQEDNQPFINGANIGLHLRFPHNVMASDLIHFGKKHSSWLEEARTKTLVSMSQTIRKRDTEKNAGHVRQHAYHMLARCGDASDRALVIEMTTTRKDLATRRTAHYAKIVNDPHPEAAEKFIYELEREPALAAITLEFDLVHYGDKGLDNTTHLKSVENVIVQNLRHIHTHQRAATAQIALQKLLNILNQFGGQAFDLRRINPRIRKILDRLQAMEALRLTGPERKFVAQFCIQ